MYNGVNQQTYRSGESIPLIAGQYLMLSCEVLHGASPPAVLEWNLGIADTRRVIQGFQVDQNVVGRKLTASSKRLGLAPSLSDHMTTVECTATHPALPHELRTSVQLDVQGK